MRGHDPVVGCGRRAGCPVRNGDLGSQRIHSLAASRNPLAGQPGVAHQVDRWPHTSVPATFPVLRGVVGRQSPPGLPVLIPPVAQGSFQAAQRRVNQAVALGVGAAGVHPAQADVVEEAEVAPEGEVVAVAPAAADHPRHCRLSRLPPHPGRLIARVVLGRYLVGHSARGALSDEVQIGQHRGPHPIPG